MVVEDNVVFERLFPTVWAWAWAWAVLPHVAMSELLTCTART